MNYHRLTKRLNTELIDRDGATGASQIKTVDEDGFVRDVVGVSYETESDAFILRLEIQKKNGELE